MPTGVTAVEPSEANGRVEQRVRALRERLQIMVDDGRRRGAEIILDHPVAQWAVRLAEWIQTPHEAHTGDKAPSNVAGFLERILVRNKINDDKQPRFLVGWPLGHKNADVITLMDDGSVRYNGSWKYSPEGRSVANDHRRKTPVMKRDTTGKTEEEDG